MPHRALKPHKKLRNQIILGMFLIFLLPLSLQVFYMLTWLRQDLINNEQQRAYGQLAVQSTWIESRLQQAQLSLQLIRSTRYVGEFASDTANDGSLSELGDAFQRMMLNNPSYTRFMLLDANGRVQVGVQRVAESLQMMTRTRDERYRFADELASALAHDTPIYIAPLNDTSESLHYIAPVYASNGETRGFLVLHVGFPYLFSDLSHPLENAVTYVIAADDERRVLSTVQPYHSTPPAVLTALLMQVDLAAQPQGGMAFDDMLATWSPVRLAEGDVFLILMKSAPIEDVLLPLRGQARWFVLVFVVCLGFVALLSYGFADRITKPLHRLIDATQHIVDGKWDALPPPIRHPDNELDVLTARFSLMAVQLQELYNSLEKLVAHRTSQLQESRQSLQAANKELQELERQRSMLISNLAHDLRNPLSSLYMRVELTARSPEKLDAHLEKITRDLRHMERLTRNLSELARMQSIYATPVMTSLDFAELLRRVLNEQHGALPPTHTLEVDMPSSPLKISGNAEQLTLMLENLLANAIKYMPQGKVRVCCQYDEPNEQISIVIEDNGVGIPPEEQPLVFKRFYRGAYAQHEKITGIGIGLALVQEVVSYHRGSIALESEVGKGTKVTVKLRKKQIKSSPSAKAV